MSHTCTAPCFPRCTSNATIVLKNLNKSFLGYNCEQHTPKNTAKDYVIESLEVPEVK